jgi:hypothetical protein
MTAEIPSAVLPLYSDRLRTLGELRLSAENAHELIHGYANFIIMKRMLTEMANAGDSNTNLANWAASVIKAEREARRSTRLHHPRRLVTVEVV